MNKKQLVTSNSDAASETRMEHPSSALELGRRISVLLDRFETRRKAADIALRSTDQLAKYEKGLTEPPFSGIARLCAKAGVRMEWLATGEGEMLVGEAGEAPASQHLRQEELTMALQLAAEALEGRYLPPDKHAELVSLMYEALVD